MDEKQLGTNEHLPGVTIAPGWRVSLAQGWQKLHKRGSVLFATVMAALSFMGPQIQQWWNNIPTDIKALIPENGQRAIAYGILFLTFVAIRYTSVRRIDREDQKDA
jgi:hypothetical protein